jgi:murein DD-endopeptidase MepM/ murein hydrolase activator NlpD
MHQGIDIGAAYGSPIASAISGTVTFAGRHGGDGNFVQVYSSKQFGTGYAHMSRMAVRVGDTVRRGQIIGYVGSTGLSTGSHLHYEVYLNGRPVDPMTINLPQVDQLTGPELGQFRARMVSLLMVRPADTMTTPIRSVAMVLPKVTARKPITG